MIIFTMYNYIKFCVMRNTGESEIGWNNNSYAFLVQNIMFVMENVCFRMKPPSCKNFYL